MGGLLVKTTGLTDQGKVLGNIRLKKREGERQGEGYYNKPRGGKKGLKEFKEREGRERG